jgi:hypothetical protein
MYRSRRVLAVVCLVAVLASCSGSKGSNSSTATETSPLEDLFGGGDEFKARQRKVEEAIATCMRDKGWKYVPVDFDQAFGQTGDNTDLNDPAKFRDKYGYGISTSPEFGGGGTEFKDPNSDYVQGLSETEQQQYYKDLDGDFFVGEDSGGVATTVAPAAPTTPSGCRSDAEKSAGASVFDDPKFGEVFGRLSEQFESDPRFVEAETKWSECMKDAGYSYTKVDEAVTDIQEQFMKLQGFNDGGFEPTDTTAAGATQSPVSTAVAIDGDGPGGPPGTSIDPVELKKLQDLEMATAKADGACQTKHTDKVRKQLEQELADQLIAEFPELKK